MNIDVSKIVSEIGDDLIAKTGEPIGLDHDQSVRVAHALAANWNKGRDEAVAQTAADTGLATEVVGAMATKLVDVAKEKLVDEGPLGDVIKSAQAQAGDAVGKAASGFLGGLFGRKAS
ncbi:MAG TPA: hypothetical protein VG841_08190 [Caulobacterales bacterium]|nr:hypothetical protein [Caulobacterales bacterium]